MRVPWRRRKVGRRAGPGCRAHLLLAAALGVAASAEANPWARVKGPAAGPAESVGASVAGCLAGAEALPLDGPGWQVVRVSRQRYYGHPTLLSHVRALGSFVRASGLGDLWIGDLAQPRGGPMPGSHVSHQSGLDADVLFDLSPKAKRPARQRERVRIESVVAPDNQTLDAVRWTEAHVRLLRHAASAAEVERIFVHPAVKQALCQDRRGAEPWLAKIRPWYGHDAHFHVRIRCPSGSPSCEAGPPLPPGDGCDESLAWWFTAEAGVMPARREVDPDPPPRPSGPPGAAPRPLPAACDALLAAPSAR